MSRAAHILMKDQPLGYHPALAKAAGGVAEAVLLGQLMYWHGKMEDKHGQEWDGWFYKSAEEIQGETGMNRCEFETARKNLLGRNLIETRKWGIPYTTHYRVDLDAVEAAIDQPANQFVDNRQTRLSNLRNQGGRTSADQTDESRQPVQEITTEITPETTSTDSAPPEKTDRAPAKDPGPLQEAAALCEEAINGPLSEHQQDLEMLFRQVPDLRYFRWARDVMVARRRHPYDRSRFDNFQTVVQQRVILVRMNGWSGPYIRDQGDP